MIITYTIREGGEQMHNENDLGRTGQPPEKGALGLRGMLVWLSQMKAIFSFYTMLSDRARKKKGPG